MEMVNLQNGGDRDSTATFKYPEGSYLKFGHFCVVPKGKVRLILQGEKFRFTLRKNHELGTPNDIINIIVIVPWKLHF